MWILALLMSWANAHAACGDAAKNSPLFKAIEACQAERAAKNADELTKYARRAGKQGEVCVVGQTTGIENAKLTKALCTDPSAFVCGLSKKGLVLDSQCRIDNYDQQHNDSPTAVDDRCKYEDERTRFIASHRSECDAKLDEKACAQHVTLKHADELKKIVQKVFYTKRRKEIARSNFNLAKRRYLLMLKNSKRIPQAKKKLLIDRVALVHLGIDEAEDKQACAIPGPELPDTGLSLSVDTRINLCSGFMSNIENMEPYTLIESFAHEISHSIDPCSLEEESNEAHHAQKVYPNLIECLRGGTGPLGCEKAIIHCLPDAPSLEKYCASKNKKAADIKSCVATANAKPSCFNIDDTEDTLTNYSTAKKGLYPADQLRESFSDFMGAEVAGSILQDVSDEGHIGVQGKRDAVISLASSFARLHGICAKDNSTVDDHPPGYLRMNRFTMGSALFRKAVGCNTTVPTPERGGTTCHAF